MSAEYLVNHTVQTKHPGELLGEGGGAWERLSTQDLHSSLQEEQLFERKEDKTPAS